MTKLSEFPVPPPWRIVLSTDDDNPLYINEITGQEISYHPLEKIMNQLTVSSELEGDTCTDIGKSSYISESPEVELSQNDNVDKNVCLTSVEKSSSTYVEFRCQWQESSRVGNVLPYGVLIRYFEFDSHVEISFDGMDGAWAYSYLESMYGPVDRYDLFLGGHVKLFGRNLTIFSANSEVCHWIDNEGNEMKKYIEWLQDKIECVGVVPVIKKCPPIPIRHVNRSCEASGRVNLRKLQIDVAKLREQICDLGLAHVLKLYKAKRKAGLFHTSVFFSSTI